MDAHLQISDEQFAPAVMQYSGCELNVHKHREYLNIRLKNALPYVLSSTLSRLHIRLRIDYSAKGNKGTAANSLMFPAYPMRLSSLQLVF